jgi:hypothetical protein
MWRCHENNSLIVVDGCIDIQPVLNELDYQ